MRKASLTAAALMLAAMGEHHIHAPVKPKPEPKPCFRRICTNLRTDDKLYCSAKCCKLDREERKWVNIGT